MRGFEAGITGTLHLTMSSRAARAASSSREVISAFEALAEPRTVAAGYRLLGLALDGAGDVDGAEQAYRQSAQLYESGGNRRSAAQIWMNLATFLEKHGRPNVEVEPGIARRSPCSMRRTIGQAKPRLSTTATTCCETIPRC
jgi:hypothetical protein